MKRIVICCVVLIALSTCTQAQVRFGIQGNLTNLNAGEQVSEIYGFGYGGGVHFDVSLPVISFRLSGDYVRFSPDQDKYRALAAKFIPSSQASQITVEGGLIEIFSGNLNLNVSVLPLPIIHVYVTGGGGFVNLRVSQTNVKFNGAPVTSVPSQENQTKPAVNVGAGVEIKLGGMTLFGELKINWIMTEGTTSTEIPLGTVGLTF